MGGVAAAAAIFPLVHSPADAWVVLAVRAISSCCVALTAIALTYRNTPFIALSLKAGWRALLSGRSLFLFKSAVSLYTTANVLLLGVLASPSVVGWFAGAEKLSKVALGATGPISQAFYPRIANLAPINHREASRALWSSAKLMIAIGLIVGTSMFIAAPLAVRILLGHGFERSIPVLRLMARCPLLSP